MSTRWSFTWKRLCSIWTIADLRNKILFTLGLLLVYRVLAHIIVPLTHQEQVNLANLLGSSKSQNLGQLLGLLDVFSGGSLQTFSIVALGLAVDTHGSLKRSLQDSKTKRQYTKER